MTAKPALLALASLILLASAKADEHYPITAPPDHRAEADAYARAAGLPPLRPSSHQELRIWVASFRGTVHGIAITPDSVKQLVTSQSYKDYSATVKPAQPTSNAKSFQPHPILRLLNDLQPYDGRMIDCLLVSDGFGYLIEGTNAGQRFIFLVSNPKSCSDEADQLVQKILGLMPGVNPEAP